MNKVFLFLFLILIQIGAQQKELDKNLTGNLNFDSGIVFQDFQNGPDAQNLYIEGKKSPILAALMSLAVPGAGEFYSGSFLKSAVFIAVEAAAITAAVIYDNKGDEQTKSFENFANGHWSVNQYAQWTIDNANRINGSVDPANYDVIDQNGSVNWKELNRLEYAIGKWYSHQLAAKGDQQYYEMIGKYPQFNTGWDDFTKSEADPYDYGDKLTDHFIYYSGERGKANDFYDVAKWAVIGVVTNHVLSAVDAAWTTSRYNKRLKMKLNIQKEQIGFRTDYYPELSLQYRF